MIPQLRSITRGTTRNFIWARIRKIKELSRKLSTMADPICISIQEPAIFEYKPAEVQRTSSKTFLLKERLLASKRFDIDMYLQSDHFNFGKKQDESLKTLQEAMKLVWSRDKPLFAIDCETHELERTKITEIGVAVIESQTYSLTPRIKTLHIIISEHQHLRNRRFVPDNKNKFMGGVSYQMTIKEAIKMLQLLMQKYLVDMNGVLVGHQLHSDISFLKSLDIIIPENVFQIDTLKLHRVSRAKGGALHMVLRALGIPYANLHNAGNDAYYTLKVLLAYCDPVVRLDKDLDVLSEGTPTIQVPPDHKDQAEISRVDSATQLMKDLF